MKKKTLEEQKASYIEELNELKQRLELAKQSIPQAEEQIRKLKHLQNSSNTHERLEYVSAELDLAMINNDIVNTNSLILLVSRRLELVEQKIQAEASESKFGLGE